MAFHLASDVVKQVVQRKRVQGGAVNKSEAVAWEGVLSQCGQDPVTLPSRVACCIT
jgi:hypothetical protein